MTLLEISLIIIGALLTIQCITAINLGITIHEKAYFLNKVLIVITGITFLAMTILELMGGI